MKRKIIIVLAIFLGVILCGARNNQANASVYETCGMRFSDLDATGKLFTSDQTQIDGYKMADGSTQGIALCAIERYWTNEDDDLGWSCDIQFNGEIFTFTLQSYHSGNDYTNIHAKAIVLSPEYFTLRDGYKFTINEYGLDEQRYFQDLVWHREGTGEFRLPIPALSANAIPVTTINRYYTDEDDDFDFYSVFEWGTGENGSNNVVIDVQNGESNSYVSGSIDIIEPRYNGDYQSYVDENGLLLRGNSDPPINNLFTFYRLPYLDEGNVLVFTTLFTYRPDDKDFSVSAFGDYGGYTNGSYSRSSQGNINVGTNYQADLGDSDSLYGFETVFLQTAGNCGWSAVSVRNDYE